MSQIHHKGAPATRCAWCGVEFGSNATRLPGRVVCDKCGVATTDPWLTDLELDDAYSGWYRPSTGRFGRLGDALFDRVRGARSRSIDKASPPGPIIDVGAGKGALVDALRARGRESVGLDPFTQRSDFLRMNAEEISGRWAAVIFWHSLEHLRRPAQALHAAARSLLPGGLILIALPNAGSIQARVFGDRWFHLDLPRHLVHVPAPVLLNHLRGLGLEIGRVSYVRGGQIVFGWLQGMVWALSRLNLYDALRVKEARSKPISPIGRLLAIVLGVVLFPFACLASLLEIVLRRSGTICVEARAPVEPA